MTLKIDLNEIEEQQGHWLSEIRQAGGGKEPGNKYIRPLAQNYDPDQPRDKIGRWTDQGSQVDSQEFKKWFGKSKVVDAEGKPLIVYHGTSADFGDQEQFDTDVGEIGAHFGTKDVADRVARSPNQMGKGNRIYPVYLSLENPLTVKDPGQWDLGKMADELVASGDMTPADRSEFFDGFQERWKAHDWSKGSYDRNKEYRDLLQRYGYDGIRYYNRREVDLPKDLRESSRKLYDLSDKEFLKRVPEASVSWVATEPTQIKSAIGNRGTFDPGDPIITHFDPDQPRDEIGRWTDTGKGNQTDTPEFKKWFKQSKVVDENGEPLVVYHGTAGDVKQFELDRIGEMQDFGYTGAGVYFIDDPEWASGYAEVAGEKTGGANVLPVYLKIENPLVISQYSELQRIRPGFSGVPTKSEALAFTTDLVKAGYDGVITKGSPGNPSEYMVIRPIQIKSATGNRGTFDPDDPIITHYDPNQLRDEIGRWTDEGGGGGSSVGLSGQAGLDSLKTAGFNVVDKAEFIGLDKSAQETIIRSLIQAEVDYPGLSEEIRNVRVRSGIAEDPTVPMLMRDEAGVKELYIDRRMMGEDYSRTVKKIGRAQSSGYLAGEGLEGIIEHEVGHFVDKAPFRLQTRWKTGAGKKYIRQNPPSDRDLSEYGAGDRTEGFAEAFSAMRTRGGPGKWQSGFNEAMGQTRNKEQGDGQNTVVDQRPPNVLRQDPTRTLVLRKKFFGAFSRRFNRLKGKILKLVVEEDAFGMLLTQNFDPDQPRDEIGQWTDGGGGRASSDQVNRAIDLNQMAMNVRWEFNTTAEKVKAFHKWLRRTIALELLAEGMEDAYWTEYIIDGYTKGAGRVFESTRRWRWDAGEGIFYDGSKAQFLRDSFAYPVAKEKVQLIAGRVFTDLNGITEDMATKMVRTLTDGLVRGKSPREVARDLNKSVELGRARSLRIARTETIRAHAEGQLDAMEILGVEEIGVAVEWSTSGMGVTRLGNPSPCPLCAPLKGIVMKLEEAKGLIPRHPNCMCSFIPANVGEDTKEQKRTKAKIRKAIDKSIRAERKKKTPMEERRKKTKWIGADTKISKVRPVSTI